MAAALALAGSPLAAHPHIFVDARFVLQFDASGKLATVQVRWDYDEFYSMTIFADRGLDPDGDGKLTAAELEKLQGFDMHWNPPDYPGDTYVLQRGMNIRLSPPYDWKTEVQNGRIVSISERRLDVPLDPATGEIVLKAYDPTFYTAYTIAGITRVEGRKDCITVLRHPDRAAADKKLAAMLKNFSGDPMSTEANFPAVGEAYADEVHLTCSARS